MFQVTEHVCQGFDAVSWNVEDVAVGEGLNDGGLVRESAGHEFKEIFFVLGFYLRLQSVSHSKLLLEVLAGSKTPSNENEGQ